MDTEKNFIIFIGGLFTTSFLKGNEVIWPLNTYNEIKLYYNKYSEKFLKNINIFKKKKEIYNNNMKYLNEHINNLGNKNLVIGQVLRCYDKIINLINKESDDSYYIFSYDWRQSFIDITDEFEKKIESLNIDEKNIIIISHSAGGIIGYNYINNHKYNKIENINRKKISKFITIGCPIQGSIKALSSILGLNNENIISGKDIQKLIKNINIKTIYELIPYNIYNSFYDDKNHLLLDDDKILEILNKYGIDKKMLYDAIDFRNNFNDLEHNPAIDYLFISGIHITNNISGFYYNAEEDFIYPNYSISDGDGTLTSLESNLDISKKGRRKFIYGKHEYLTEYDDLLNIIKDEISIQKDKNMNIMIISEIIELPSKENDFKIKFRLFLIKDNKKYFIDDISSKKIIFINKNDFNDITFEIKKNKINNYFYFKTEYTYGLLKLNQLIIKYSDNYENKINSNENNNNENDNNENNNLETLFIKNQIIEFENQDNLNILF